MRIGAPTIITHLGYIPENMTDIKEAAVDDRFGKVSSAYFYRAGGTPKWSWQNWMLKKELAGIGSIINITNTAKHTEIGPNLYATFSAAVPVDEAISDAGIGTMGVKKTVSLLNNWVNYDESVWENAGYIKDSNGTVHLVGMIKNGTVTSGTVLFTLPAVDRPRKTRKFAVASSQSTLTELEVRSNGDVVMISGGSAYLSLNAEQKNPRDYGNVISRVLFVSVRRFFAR